MRYRKGNKVEVLNMDESPSGSWHCAEIISGNGHNYTIRYESEAVVDRVPRKAIRPCPPPQQGLQNWLAGDVVEVFSDLCWKIARISKVMGGDRYLVRLLGSCHQLTVHRFHIRLRQSWEDDKWFVIGKNSERCKDTIYHFQKAKFQELLPDRKRKVVAEDDHACFKDPNVGAFHTYRPIKRAFPFEHAKVYAAESQRIRADKDAGKCRQSGPDSQAGKVDAVVYPRENLGEKCTHASFNNETTGYFEMERSKAIGVVNCLPSEILQTSISDSVASSVGSCSFTSTSSSKFSSFVACSSEDSDTGSSAAESFDFMVEKERKNPFPSKEEVVAEIHRLELHAYHHTLKSLFAYGPLSWEHEDLLTGLRLSLHVTNDEHLMEGQNGILALLPRV